LTWELVEKEGCLLLFILLLLLALSFMEDLTDGVPGPCTSLVTFIRDTDPFWLFPPFTVLLFLDDKRGLPDFMCILTDSKKSN
jgi:hypothetical protein